MSLPATETENTRPIEPCQRFEGHTEYVLDVIHLQSGQQIMTCSDDGSLRVWSLQTGKQITIWQDGESSVYSLALSMDGKKVVSGSTDGIVRLWSIETGKVIARWTGHTSIISSVCWNQDGVRVLSGSWDGTATVWHVETGKTILQISTGIAIVADDQFIKIWDANTGKPIAILKGHTSYVRCLAWTANGRTLISGSSDGTIRTWDTCTWQQLAVLTGHTKYVYCIAISPNDRILASASWDKTTRLWNLDSGRPIGLPLHHPYGALCVSFSTDGTLLATGCYDNNAYTWDIPVIMKEVGLEELLVVDDSLLHADATRRPIQQPNNPRVISTGFFATTSNVPDRDPHITLPTSPPVVPEGASLMPLLAVSGDAPPDVQQQSSPEQFRLKSFNSNTSARPTFPQRAPLPFFKRPQRHNNQAIAVPEDAPPEVQPNSPEQARPRFLAQPTFPQMARLPFFKRPQIHDGVELVLPVVDVPLGVGNPRNYSVGQERARQKREKEKAKQAKLANKLQNAKNASTSSQLHSPGSVIRPANPSYIQPSSVPHPAASPIMPATAISAPVTTLAAPVTGTINLQVGCLTRFLLHFGCVSAPRHN